MRCEFLPQLQRQKRYQLYGPWEHILSSIWTEEEAPEVDEEEEDTFLCHVCGKEEHIGMLQV